jgi:hypothetical protein
MSEGGKMFIEQILRNRRLATRKIWPRPDAMFNSRKSLGPSLKAPISRGMSGSGGSRSVKSYRKRETPDEATFLTFKAGISGGSWFFFWKLANARGARQMIREASVGEHPRVTIASGYWAGRGDRPREAVALGDVGAAASFVFSGKSESTSRLPAPDFAGVRL